MKNAPVPFRDESDAPAVPPRFPASVQAGLFVAGIGGTAALRIQAVAFGGHSGVANSLIVFALVYKSIRRVSNDLPTAKRSLPPDAARCRSRPSFGGSPQLGLDPGLRALDN